MTTIQERGVSEIHAEFRPLQKPERSVTSAHILLAVGIATTLLNVAVALFLSNALGGVRSVQTQFSNLSDFEKRMTARIDLVNTGIQGQIEKLRTNLPARLDVIESEIAKLEKVLAASQVQTDPVSDLAAQSLIEPDEPVILGVAEETVDPVIKQSVQAAPVRLRRASSKPVAAPSPAYQRIETQDGKVHYKKVR